MVGLLDIAPAVETVTVRGTPLPVYGVSAAGVAYLLGKFPELRKLLTGYSMDQDKLLSLAPEVIAAVIASGCGVPGDKDAEAIAATLSVNEQYDLVAAIWRLTMPDGVGPFVQKLAALGEQAKVTVSAIDPSATAPDMKSPKRSRRSSPSVTPPPMSGDTPQESSMPS